MKWHLIIFLGVVVLFSSQVFAQEVEKSEVSEKTCTLLSDGSKRCSAVFYPYQRNRLEGREWVTFENISKTTYANNKFYLNYTLGGVNYGVVFNPFVMVNDGRGLNKLSLSDLDVAFNTLTRNNITEDIITKYFFGFDNVGVAIRPSVIPFMGFDIITNQQRTNRGNDRKGYSINDEVITHYGELEALNISLIFNETTVLFNMTNFSYTSSIELDPITEFDHNNIVFDAYIEFKESPTPTNYSRFGASNPAKIGKDQDPNCGGIPPTCATESVTKNRVVNFFNISIIPSGSTVVSIESRHRWNGVGNRGNENISVFDLTGDFNQYPDNKSGNQDFYIDAGNGSLNINFVAVADSQNYINMTNATGYMEGIINEGTQLFGYSFRSVDGESTSLGIADSQTEGLVRTAEAGAIGTRPLINVTWIEPAVDSGSDWEFAVYLIYATIVFSLLYVSMKLGKEVKDGKSTDKGE